MRSASVDYMYGSEDWALTRSDVHGTGCIASNVLVGPSAAKSFLNFFFPALVYDILPSRRSSNFRYLPPSYQTNLPVAIS